MATRKVIAMSDRRFKLKTHAHAKLAHVFRRLSDPLSVRAMPIKGREALAS